MLSLPNFMCMLSMAVARSLSGGVVICFMDDVIHMYLHIS